MNAFNIKNLEVEVEHSNCYFRCFVLLIYVEKSDANVEQVDKICSTGKPSKGKVKKNQKLAIRAFVLY